VIKPLSVFCEHCLTIACELTYKYNWYKNKPSNLSFSQENCINGLIKEKSLLTNHVDYSRLNGDSGKRMAEEAAGDSTPAKKPALEAVVTNGFANGNGTAQPQQQQQVNGSVKLGGQVVQVVSNNAAQQFQGQVVQIQGQMVQGQMVQGQMVQGQMVQGQMVQGQMVQGHHQVIQGQVIQGHQMGGQVVQVMTTSSGGGGGQVVHVTGATAAGGTAGQILVSSSGNDAFRK